VPIPLKVEAVLPEGVKGLSAETITIAADREEAKLTIEIAADAVDGAAGAPAIPPRE